MAHLQPHSSLGPAFEGVPDKFAGEIATVKGTVDGETVKVSSIQSAK
jgi:hypothetical protein